MKHIQQHMIKLEVQGFILDHRVRESSPNTIAYYEQELGYLVNSCQFVEEITPTLIREGLLLHGAAWFRAVKAFLLWFEKEEDIPDWKNPVRKVTPPPVRHDPLPGVTPDVIQTLLSACDKSSLGIRNRVIILMLFDTGARVSELCNLNIENVNLETGSVTILHGKGDKTRTTFIGTTTRRELIKYLRYRNGEPSDPLFLGRFSLKRITRRSIATMLDLLAIKANTQRATPHDFRRAFTKASLKRADVVSVARLLGHADTSLVWRYYYQNTEDLQKAHEASSPVDYITKARR